MNISILFFGFLFGYAMQYARLNRFNTISGMATLEDFTMAKTMGFAIGLGSILISVLIALDLASYHVKPFMPVADITGGLIFGVGMAVLGYCPGTLPISLGQGALDAGVGILGGLLGGLIFTLFFDQLKPLLGVSYGNLSLYSETGDRPVLFHVLTAVFGLALMFGALWLNKREKRTDRRWLVTGVAFALINAVMIMDEVFSRPIGASTAYPYASALLSGQVENSYFRSIQGPGSWELVFLAGAFLAGLIPALLTGEFRINFVQQRWKSYFDDAVLKRAIWAFIGGFLLIFGARVAGGCASGHILSGTMQVGYGSLLFSVFTFLAFFVTGHYFYKKNIFNL